MKKIKTFVLIPILAGLLLFNGCKAANYTEPTSTPDIQELVQTSVAQTLTAIPLIPTATLKPATSTPTTTATPLNSPTYDWRPTKAPCNGMEWIQDVTIPDNTHIVPGTQFVKTWRIMNSGSCDWNTNWQLAFDSGEQMGGLLFVPIPRVVPSGTMVDVSVLLTAPMEIGLHTGGWKMMSPSGVKFGSGDGTAPITVQIITDLTAFSVTSVDITVDSSSNTSACPPGHSFTFFAAITVSAPGTVTLQWLWSDGTPGPSDSITFTGPGTKFSNATWTVTSSQSGFARVYIDYPNRQNFGPGGSFTMTCTSP